MKTGAVALGDDILTKVDIDRERSRVCFVPLPLALASAFDYDYFFEWYIEISGDTGAVEEMGRWATELYKFLRGERARASADGDIR
jgi:hypothetical protein